MLLRSWGSTFSVGTMGHWLWCSAGDVNGEGRGRACHVLCFYRWEDSYRTKEDKEEVESQEVSTWTEGGVG